MPRKSKELVALYYYVGKRICQLRQSCEMSQADLAAKLGKTRTALTNIESGNQRVTLEDLYRVALALGVSPGSLLPDVSTRVLQTTEEAFVEFLNQPVDSE